MLPLVRPFAILGAASLVACATHAPSPALPVSQGSSAVAGSRLGNLRDLVLAEDRELVPLETRIGPRYPEEGKRQRIEARVPTAFIVDTLGVVEPNSITFLGTPAVPLGFRQSVCEFLVSRARFAPFMRDARRRRAFVLQPFNFSMQSGPPSGILPIITEQREAIRRASWDSVATLLAKQPHCG